MDSCYCVMATSQWNFCVILRNNLSFFVLFCSDIWDGEHQYVLLHQSDVSTVPGHTSCQWRPGLI